MSRPDVLLLRWPEQDRERREHAGRDTPVLLVLERGGPVPDVLGPLEDWLHADAPPEEVAMRLARMAQRADELRQRPRIDDCILHHGGRWVDLTDVQVPVAELLIANLDTVVSSSAIRTAYLDAGGSSAPGAFRSLLHRLNLRFGEVGLSLRSIRNRGVIATVDGAAGPPSRRPGAGT